jgi:hypothetical protein
MENSLKRRVKKFEFEISIHNDDNENQRSILTR